MGQKPIVYGLIPVRGGSKSIPEKNIKMIAGKSLVIWSLEAAIRSDIFDKVFVATDSNKIKSVVSDYVSTHLSDFSSMVEIIGRSEACSTDSASTEMVMEEFTQKYKYDILFLIQATNPIVTYEDFQKAYKKYMENSYDSLLTVVRQKRFVWKEGASGVYPVNYKVESRPLRQNFEGMLVENGSFYITSYDNFMVSKCRLSGNIGYHEMDEATYYEIDETHDWIIIESLLKINSEKNIPKDIMMVVTDNDGVLTDAGMYYTESGESLKKYNTKDGMGFGLLRSAGVKTAIITGENSNIVTARAEKLKIDEVCLGVSNKVLALKDIAKKYGLDMSNIVYIGDDINDLDVMDLVRFSFAVADASSEVKKRADKILTKRGGEGAVREAIDWLIYNKSINEYNIKV